ncbi:MAG: PAS domain S-box protein [Candidatus Stygibacter australis]|nr:PAS domain S-box protein [Candidatus Stygibacter australis]MDP8321114.1 PAS domain S-box protein [Candidatus Stygibacter australis]
MLTKVLYLEDDIVDYELVKEYLQLVETFNHDLILVKDFEMLHSELFASGNSYNVILMDLGLKDSRGIETFERYLDLGLQIPVIILTGLDDELTGLEAIAEGAQDYLVKGRFNEITLVKAIRYAIERSKIEKKLADNELQYRTIFESVTDALIIHDKSGRIIEINPAATELYGYSREEFLDLQVTDLVHEDRKKFVEESIINISQGYVHRGESKDICLDGRDIYTSIVSKQIHYQGEEKVLSVIHDITALKETEEKLKRHRAELEEQVKERTVELRKKYDELEHHYTLVIGREFRIKELRDEVAALKQEIHNMKFTRNG